MTGIGNVSEMGIPFASVRARRTFIGEIIRSSHEIIASCELGSVEEKNVRQRVHRLMRDVIITFWETPSNMKYSTSRLYSREALKFKDASRKDKMKKLRYEHAIPLKLIVDELLRAYDKPRRITNILKKVEARLVTVPEDKRLNKVHRSTIPGGLRAGIEGLEARYKAANIVFDRR